MRQSIIFRAKNHRRNEMRKMIGLLAIFMLQTSAFAQTDTPARPTPPGSDNQWHDWVFAAGALVVAIGGMIAVSISQGKKVEPGP